MRSPLRDWPNDGILRPGPTAPNRRRQGRQSHGRRRRTRRGAVDDQHRHGRCRRHGETGRSARARRLGTGAHHRRPRRGRGRRAAHQGAAAADECRRAAGRRLPLHRPQAAGRSSGLRRGARQVPHQSRQCRLQGKEGSPVRHDRRDGDQVRQAGAHRRQLGLARPGTAHAPDGRECALRASGRCARRDARGDGAIGTAVGRARRGDRPAAFQNHHLRPKCRRCRI